MVISGHVGNERFNEGNHGADLARVVESLVGIPEAKLPLFGKPPGHIGAGFVLPFMRRQASLPFLIIEVASQLKTFCHETRAADEEINSVGPHMVSEWEP